MASIPDTITGKSVGDTATKLYDALINEHPNAQGFHLDYLITKFYFLIQEQEEKLEAKSREEFISAFEQYHREGRFKGRGCDMPNDLYIYYKENGQYSDQYYGIGGVRKSSPGFESKMIKFLLDNPVARVGIALPILGRVKAYLKDVLQKANECIETVEREPFYIPIKQLTKEKQ